MKKIISLLLTMGILMNIFIPVHAVQGSMDGWWAAKNGTLDSEVVVDTTHSHSGKASAKLTRKTAYKSNTYMSLTQSVAVEKGKTYQYGFWAKAKNINSVSTLINWNARAYLSPITNTYDWTYFSFKYTHNGESGSVTFKIIVDGPTSALWVDDMEFYEYDDKKVGENLFKNPGFEGATTAPKKDEATSNISENFTQEDFDKTVATAGVVPVYKTNGITIDGNVEDWQECTKLDLPKSEEQVQAYSTSEYDAKVSMSFAYDDKYLYFLTSAEDDVYEDKQGSEYWQGDSVQLCLSQQGQSYGAEIGYSYDEDGGGKYSVNFGENQMSGLRLKTSRNGNVTYYESAIPWDLYYGQRKDDILFSALYNDNDGSGRKYALQMSPGIAEGKVNTKFQTLRMVPSDCDYFAWSEGASTGTVFETDKYNVCVLNDGQEEKTFIISVGEQEKTVRIPANSGQKSSFDLTYSDVGKTAFDFTVTDGVSKQTFSHAVSVLATSDYYDAKLLDLKSKSEEINRLIKKCNDVGISTDYEEPVAFILNRFQTYLKEDIDRAYYDIMDYGFEELDRMYMETKGKLNGYISGEKKSLSTPKYKTDSIAIDGLTQWATTKNGEVIEKRPVFFVGYGHFAEAKEDISNFNGLGVNSLQNEIGTYDIVSTQEGIPAFSNRANNFKAEYSIVEDKNIAKSGKHCIKIKSSTPMQNNCYSNFHQWVAVESGETYEFGASVKTTNAKKFWMSMMEWPGDDNRKQLGGSYDWKEVSYEYTVPQGETSTMFQVMIEDTADEILIDKLWVRKKGTKTNLLKNGDLELKYEDIGENIRLSTAKATAIIDALKESEKNDVSMSLLISPHYWPTAVVQDEEVKNLQGSMQWMNMKNDEAKAIMENYLRCLLPAVKKYKSLTNICLTNEPALISSVNDYYHDDFVAYLKDVYNNDLAEMNRIYGSEYQDFQDVKMPTDTLPSVILYDWKQFNDKLVYEWTSWVAKLVHEYLPNVPVHCKIMQNTYENDASLRMHMKYGSNIEYYAALSDVHGCDAFNYYNPGTKANTIGTNTNPTVTNALEKTLWYDLLTSVKFMPIYNTEDHIIADNSGTYNHNIAYHTGTDIWQGALHGRGNSVIWVWSRNYNDQSLSNSILTRPDAILAVSEQTLDLNRLSYEVTALENKQPTVGIIWSDTSRVYQNSYMNNLYKAYEACVYNGQKTAFISENQIEKIYNYDVVICPNVTNVKASVAEEISKYAKSGKNLILMGDECFSADEHNQPLSASLSSEIRNNSTLIQTTNDSFKMIEPTDLQSKIAVILDKNNLRRVRIIDTDTGEDAQHVEALYTDYDGKPLLNLVLYDWNKDLNVKILLDGVPITKSIELKSTQEYDKNFVLKSYQPVLLKLESDAKINDSKVTLQVNNSVITVNGERTLIDSGNVNTIPVIEKERTLMPIRAIVEAMGGEVIWDEKTKTTTLNYNGKSIKITMSSEIAYVGDVKHTLDVTPAVINGRTMLPIRFIAENFDWNISWNDLGKIITITK